MNILRGLIARIVKQRSGDNRPAYPDHDLAQRTVATFATVMPDATVNIVSDLELQVRKAGETSPTTIYLHNLARQCANDPEAADELVSGFVRSWRGNNDAQPTLNLIYPALRAREYMEAARERLETAHAPLNLPFVADITILYVADQPNHLSSLTAEFLIANELTLAELHAHAVRNAMELEPLTFRPLDNRPGILLAQADDALGCARIFNERLWQDLEADLGGPVAIAAPTRDWLLAARLDYQDDLLYLRELSARIVDGEAYAVSASLFRRDGAGWCEVLPAH